MSFLQTLAREQVDKLPIEPTGLFDVFYMPELKRLGFDLVKDMQFMAKEKVPADGFKESVTMASVIGIAFGSAYPELTEKLWANTHGKSDPETWKLAWQSGLDVPETPDEPISIEDGQENLMPVFEYYVHQPRPEMRGLLL